MSDQKLEALVGHLFVVGGKTIQSAPPGTLVELPPRRAHRSREEDTLFVLITAAGRKAMSGELYDELARLGADAYYRSRVGVTGALRDAFNAVNERLYGSEFRAGAIFLSKRRDEIYIARSGTTLCALRSPEGYETFPGDPDLLNILPLGSRSEPSLEFARYALTPGNVYVLGDAAFATVSDKVLEACISQGEVEQILDQLESVVTKDATASIIQFVLPNAERPAAPQTQPQTSPPPVEQTTASMVSPRDFASTRNQAPSVPTTQKSSADLDVMVETRPEPEVARSTPQPEFSVAQDGVAPSRSTPSDDAPESPIPGEGFLPYNEPLEAEEEMATGIGEVSEAELQAEALATTDSVGAPPQEAPAARPRRRERVTENVAPASPVKKRSKNILGRALGMVGRGINTALTRLLPEPEDATNRETVPFNVVVLLAIFIPVVIAIVVVGFSISDQGNTRFEQLRLRAFSAHEQAQEYSSTAAADQQTARDYWEISRGEALAALRENPADKEIEDILRESLLKLDFYDRVRRVQIQTLREYEDNADLRGPIMSASGVDIFTLDKNRAKVYRDTLNTLGNEIIDSEDLAVIQRGQRIREHTVSNLIDIEWMDEGGAVQRNALIALDENGLLVSYNPTFGADGLKLILPPDWRRPVAISIWGRNLYILDAGSNQIWRFVPVDGFYNELPSEYFTGAERPNLASALDFTIDEQGAVYILFQDGHIEKFLSGEPQAFDLYEGPVDGLQNARAIFVDNSPISYALYVADRGNEALYQISLGGKVNDGYRPSSSPLDALGQISGVFVDGSRNTLNIYVLSGQTLYYFSGS